MSSFIGHALTGAGIALTTRKQQFQWQPRALLWTGWLMVAALVPDLDYVIPALHRSAHDGLRVSHSIAYCLWLPAVTWLLLRMARCSPRQSFVRSGQALLATLSHLVLDLLVGVTSLPIFWPLSLATLKLPFGVLPSAPGYSLTNDYLYRNSLIELGIFVPFWLGLYWLRHSPTPQHQRYCYLLWLVTLCFVGWAYTLAR